MEEKKYKVTWSMFFGATDQLQEGGLLLEAANSLEKELNAEGDHYIIYKVEEDI